MPSYHRRRVRCERFESPLATAARQIECRDSASLYINVAAAPGEFRELAPPFAAPITDAMTRAISLVTMRMASDESQPSGRKMTPPSFSSSRMSDFDAMTLRRISPIHFTFGASGRGCAEFGWRSCRRFHCAEKCHERRMGDA